MLSSPSHRVSIVLAALALIVALAPMSRAADEKNATGTWKWTQQGRQGGNPIEFTMKLKQDGEKVTGTVTGFQGNEIEIKDGTIKDNTLSFSTSVTRNEQTFTTKYSGKLEGDTIKGKATSERNGQTRERDWEAKRAPEDAAK